MRSIVAAALPCVVIPFIVEAELTVSSWDFTKDTANTVPWAAADWDDADNWSAGVPDGSGWRAELTGAEETRYVRMNRPVTLGYLLANQYDADGTCRMKRPIRSFTLPKRGLTLLRRS